MTDGEPAPAAGYSSPKRAILLLLKRQPDVSLAEMSRELAISKAATLAHVQKLESDGLVGRSYAPGKVGRPRVLFRLTGQARSLFPHGFTEMSLYALGYIEKRLGRPAVTELLQTRAADVADRARPRLDAPTLSGRVAELARWRTEEGYMAEVGPRHPASVELLEHHCPILELAERYPEACETERRMFESLLDARVAISHRVVAGDPVCRFCVRAKKERP